MNGNEVGEDALEGKVEQTLHLDEFSSSLDPAVLEARCLRVFRFSVFKVSKCEPSPPALKCVFPRQIIPNILHFLS